MQRNTLRVISVLMILTLAVLTPLISSGFSELKQACGDEGEQLEMAIADYGGDTESARHDVEKVHDGRTG